MPRPELHAQTAIRGVAALTVFIVHAAFYRLFPEYPLVGSAYHIFYWSDVSVDLFFELSGFILCYVYCSKNFTWKEYLVARISRIYPLYLVGLLFSIAVHFSRVPVGNLSAQTFPWGVGLTNLFLVQDWPFSPHFRSLNPPTWSISVEMFLYVGIFPALFYGREHLGRGGRYILAAGPVIILAVIYLFIYHLWFNATMSFWGPIRGILCFISGFFTCTLGLHHGFSGRLPRAIEALFLIVTTSSLFFKFPFSRGAIVVAFPLLVYLAAQGASLLTKLVAIPALCWLGDISYSIYVWHWPMMSAVSHLFSLLEMPIYSNLGISLSLRCLFVLVEIISVIGISHLSHFYFERPVNRWLRRSVADRT